MGIADIELGDFCEGYNDGSFTSISTCCPGCSNEMESVEKCLDTSCGDDGNKETSGSGSGNGTGGGKGDGSGNGDGSDSGSVLMSTIVSFMSLSGVTMLLFILA